MNEEVNMNPFQREELKKYQEFLNSAKSYFPNHIGLKRLKEDMVDFQLLLATIFEARSKYPSLKDESQKLCEDVAAFSTRNIDKKDRFMFQNQLLYECSLMYQSIVDKHMSVQVDSESIEIATKEITEHFFIEEILRYFQQESWAHLAMDLDIDVLVVLIMQTDAYKNHEEYALQLVYDIAAYECSNIQEDEREMFIEQYLEEIQHSEKELLDKFALSQTKSIYNISGVESQGRVLFEKEIQKNQTIIVQTSKKTAKNKRQKSAENQILDLVKKGKSFEVLPKPKNTKHGIKRIVIRLSFDALIEYIKSILPANATFNYQNDSVKVLFGNLKQQYKSNKKQRVVFSRQ